MTLRLPAHTMRYVVAVSVTLGCVTLYMLATASANTQLFAQQYSQLLILNGVLVLCLMLLVGYQFWALRRKLKSGVFGARLTLRLTLLFSVMAIVPGAVIYGVSVQFLSRSIESWFDVKVDKALEGGLNLGHSALDSLLKDTAKRATTIANALSDQPVVSSLAILNSLREQTGVQEAALFNTRGAILAFAGNEKAGVIPDVPAAAILRQARVQPPYSAIESVPDKGILLRVIVPVQTMELGEAVRFLQVLQPVPKQLQQDAEIVQAGYRDYQELSLSRTGLKRLYGLTLTLTLLLALLSALALAVLLSERLSAPLSILAEGTRAVAQGDFTLRHPVKSQDELGVLTQSFNTMTHQLAEARMAADQNQRQIETANAYLESVLSNMSAGVLAFDETFQLRSANTSACAILQVQWEQLRWLSLEAWPTELPALAVFSARVLAAFREPATQTWQDQIDFNVAGQKHVLLMRGTRLPSGSEKGYVVVFDEVSDLLRAQRDAAWGEVARRLAHEIKNPLTPIQLSAERLEHKLTSKLDEADAQILQRGTQTIVRQVSAMKNMVDDFAQYARSPRAATSHRLELHSLLREIMVFYETAAARITFELGAEHDGIKGDPTQIRQVIHNLVQNAQDALADNTVDPHIAIRTEEQAGRLLLTLTDNGSGIPAELMSQVFEPYVTSKQKGTGLGLAIVKKIVEEHEGKINIRNITPHGAQVSIEFPLMGT